MIFLKKDSHIRIWDNLVDQLNKKKKSIWDEYMSDLLDEMEKN